MATTTKERPREAGSAGIAARPAPVAACAWADASTPSLASLLRWVEANGDALVGVDAAGRVAFANAAFGRVFALAASPSRGAAERPGLSRFVPLLTPPRLLRWVEESAAVPGAPQRVHRLLAESVGTDGDRFLAAVTLLPVPSGGGTGKDPDTACLVSLRPLDGPRGLSSSLHDEASHASGGGALGGLVDAALRALGALGARRRCRVALHARDARIAVDPEPVREALVRVIDNACRYATHGAPVRIASSIEPADPHEGAGAIDRVVVTVADRGPGLARAHAQRAFDPFWRGPGTARVPGQGLGLAIARELVDAQRGWIELRSAPGIGTEVDLWLPAA
ncbi:MAG: sensor histidine kinase [Burkholderiales bacterium]